MVDFWGGFEKQAKMGLERLEPFLKSHIMKQNVREGLGFLGIPLVAASKAVLGKKKTVKGLKAIHAPLSHADTELGHHLDKLMQKMPFGKNMFKQEEMVNVGKDKFEKMHRPSVLAPVSKATEVAKPVVFGLAATKAIEDLKNKKEKEKAQREQALKSLTHG